MATIAPAQSSLRVMPTAAVPDAQLFTQIPSATAGLQLFEQAAKLPLLMEQIKMEKTRQKAEKAKLDLAELTAQQQMKTFEEDQARAKALQEAQLAAEQQRLEILKAQAAASGKTPQQLATEQANAAITQDAMLQAARVGIDPNSYVEAGTGRLDLEGLRADIMAKSGAAPLAAEQVGAAPVPEAIKATDELSGFASRMVNATPRAVAAQRYAADNPQVPLASLPAAEQTRVLAPYLQSAQPKKRDIQFIKDGDKFETTVTESADGLVVYGIDEPRKQSSAPETRATATVKTKLAFIDATIKKIDELDKNLDAYDKAGAFGAYDVQMAQWAQNPEKPVLLRAAASWLGEPITKSLSTDLAAIGAKTMTELAGSAQTAGEAQRLGPYVPAASDPVQGKEALRAKIRAFKKELGISRDSLETQFGLKTKQAATPEATPATAPASKLDDAISAYVNAP